MACANIVLKTSAANLLNSEVSIYLWWLWLLSLFAVSVTLELLLTSGVFFSTVANAAFVAKLLISGILFSNWVNFVF